MKNIIKIFCADFRRLSTNVVAVVVIMGLSVIPSLYAWFNILSNWDPYAQEATSNLKIAVVSQDEGTEVAGISMNIGDNVLSGLKENKTIGWVFPDTLEEATDGVYSGEYYAALVISKDFSKDMVSFMSGDVTHPKITYYENEKKNAIAPKITSKAKTAVQEQVNSTFVSTIAESLMKVSNVLVDTDGNVSLVDAVTGRLDELDGDLQNYINIMNSFISVTGSASSLIDTTQVMIPDLNDLVGNGQNTVNAMQGAVTSGTASADTVSDMVSYSLDMIGTTLDQVSSMIQNDLSNLEGKEGSVTNGLAGAQAIMPYLKQMFGSTTSSIVVYDGVDAQVIEIQTQFDQISTDLEAVSTNAGAGSDAVKALEQQILGEISTCKTKINALGDTYTYSIKPQLRSTINSMQGSLNSAQAILSGVDGDLSGVTDVLEEYGDTLSSGMEGLVSSRDMAVDMKEKLDQIRTDITTLTGDEQYKELLDVLKTDPELLGSFISSPVALDTEAVYEIANYGSSMSPFYTILAIWVGALILVAIIHVKVHPEPGIMETKPYQQFFGRYITFFLIGQVQTLIAVLGDLFYIKIQCHNPFLFWFACAMSSFAFTMLIYSLTVAFETVGEAVAVVIMVIQVAGAGGTFPIETLPKIYQAIYRFLPFSFGMNALRETIGGMYAMTYWKCILKLCIVVCVGLFIGLVVAVPFRKLNRMIDKSKEKSGIML